jgi:flagellar assembly factor FliW
LSAIGEADYFFPAGLPAFETETRFHLAEPERLRPIVWMESLLTPGLRFICVPVETLDPAYQLEIGEGDLALLGAGSGETGLRRMAIVTFPADEAPTANLRAPLVLNPATHQGLQVVRADDAYSFFHPLRPAGGGESSPCS